MKKLILLTRISISPTTREQQFRSILNDFWNFLNRQILFLADGSAQTHILYSSTILRTKHTPIILL